MLFIILLLGLALVMLIKVWWSSLTGNVATVCVCSASFVLFEVGAMTGFHCKFFHFDMKLEDLL